LATRGKGLKSGAFFNRIIIFFQYLIQDRHISIDAHAEVSGIKVMRVEIPVMNEDALVVVYGVAPLHLVSFFRCPIDPVF
jgi:hypothetical protein